MPEIPPQAAQGLVTVRRDDLLVTLLYIAGDEPVAVMPSDVLDRLFVAARPEPAGERSDGDAPARGCKAPHGDAEGIRSISGWPDVSESHTALRDRYALTVDARDLDAALNGEGQEQWAAEGRLREAMETLARALDVPAGGEQPGGGDG